MQKWTVNAAAPLPHLLTHAVHTSTHIRENCAAFLALAGLGDGVKPSRRRTEDEAGRGCWPHSSTFHLWSERWPTGRRGKQCTVKQASWPVTRLWEWSHSLHNKSQSSSSGLQKWDKLQIFAAVCQVYVFFSSWFIFNTISEESTGRPWTSVALSSWQFSFLLPFTAPARNSSLIMFCSLYEHYSYLFIYKYNPLKLKWQ